MIAHLFIVLTFNPGAPLAARRPQQHLEDSTRPRHDPSCPPHHARHRQNFEVWCFMPTLITTDKSSDDAKKSAKNIYANLITQVKMYLDWAATTGMRGAYTNSTQNLQDLIEDYI
ncbi:hypothetical protein V500_00760 [Pseudogymnoascus sp. VKM F-4518 (FW-2643)]|nr:hypothetical protein V500_00760 [Pseudogymnoascus sp. VKM F-4518 (FW-2643)]